MIDVSKIKTAFTGLVGFSQPYNPAYATLTTAATTSASGRYVNDNPFCKVEFLKENADYKSISSENFSASLINLVNNAAVSVLNNVFNESDFIDRQILYKNANNKQEIETLPAGFVGYKIEKSNKNNIGVKISRVFCEFQNTGTFALLLFNSQKTTPIQTKEVVITSSMQEVSLDWTLDNTGGLYEGEWYIGYIAGSLMPYSREWENASYMSHISELEVESIKVIGHSENTLFNLDSTESADECWGLNFDITVYNDYTDLAINNKSLFAKAIQIQSQVDCLSSILSSARSNEIQRISNEMLNKIIVELDGLNTDDGLNKVGLKTLLGGEIQRLRKEITRIRDGYFATGLTLNTAY